MKEIKYSGSKPDVEEPGIIIKPVPLPTGLWQLQLPESLSPFGTPPSSTISLNTEAVIDIFNPNPRPKYNFERELNYEISDHLGNVRAVVGGIKNPGTNEPNIEYLVDYYPFGSIMPGRKYVGEDYRFSFNGHEKDDNIQGDGNSINYGDRIYDSRLGRFTSPDRYGINHIEATPYEGLGNNPILYFDPDGRDIIPVNYSKWSNKQKKAWQILKQTEWGKKLFYAFDDEYSPVDIYVGRGKGFSRNGVNAAGVTLNLEDEKNKRKFLRGNRIIIDIYNKKDNYRYNDFNNREIDGNRRNYMVIMDDDDLDDFNEYEIAYMMLHELMSHVLIDYHQVKKGQGETDGDLHHDLFGETGVYPGFISDDPNQRPDNTIIRKGSVAEEVFRNVKNVQSRDLNRLASPNTNMMINQTIESVKFIISIGSMLGGGGTSAPAPRFK